MNQLLSPTPFGEVNIVLHHFLAHIQPILAGHFQGMYLVGSLALGDFNPARSDIDFIVITDTVIEDVCFDALQTMHAQFAASNSPWAGRIEAIYVPVFTLHPTAAHAVAEKTACYPQLEKGLSLVKAPLESGWVFQCLTIRDHSVVVAGRDPHTLVDFIDPQVCHAAAAAITGGWLEQAANDPTWLPWLRQRDAQTFVIFTLCRLLYSLATGSVASKPRAAEWARRIMGEPWASLIERTLARQHEAGNISQSEEDETLAFIQFTLEQSMGRA